MKKVILILCLALLVGGFLFARGAQESSSREIAYFMPHLDNEWANDQDAALRREITAAGYTPVQYVANRDVSRQINQVEQAVSRRVAGMLLNSIDGEALIRPISAAQSAGIPVVNVHEGVNSEVPFAQIRPDFVEGGRLKMAEAIKDMPNGGNIAFLYGPQGHPAHINISSGYPIALRGVEGRFPVVFEGHGNWAEDSGLNVVGSWLASGVRIDAIISDNDGMAMGVIRAIEAAGRTGQILLYGLDGTQRSFAAIRDGNMTATIATPVNDVARMGMEQLLNAINGRPKQGNGIIMLPMPIVNRSNVQQWIK